MESSKFNFKIIFDVMILSLIFLIVSVMGGVGFDFAVSSEMVSLHSLRNILIAAVVFWLIKKNIYKENKFVKTDLDLPVFIYLATFILAAIFSSQPKTSILYFRDFLLYAAMPYLLINNIDNKKKLKALLFILIISVLYTVGMGILQHLERGKGLDDNYYYSFIGRNEVGAVVVLTIPLLISYFYIYKEKLLAVFFLIIGLIILITGLMISYSRGSWIGFLCVILAFFSLYDQLFKKIKFIILVFLISVLFLLVLPKNIEKRGMSILNYKNEGTITERFYIWKSSINMIKSFPVFGIGPGTYDEVYSKYKLTKAQHNEGKGWHAHNIFLHIASENGLFNLVSFLAIIAVSFKKYFELKSKVKDEKLKDLLNGAIVSLIGYLACSQSSIFFANHNKNEKISMFLWLDIALIFIIENIYNKQEKNETHNSCIKK